LMSAGDGDKHPHVPPLERSVHLQACKVARLVGFPTPDTTVDVQLRRMCKLVYQGCDEDKRADHAHLAREEAALASKLARKSTILSLDLVDGVDADEDEWDCLLDGALAPPQPVEEDEVLAVAVAAEQEQEQGADETCVLEPGLPEAKEPPRQRGSICARGIRQDIAVAIAPYAARLAQLSKEPTSELAKSRSAVLAAAKLAVYAAPRSLSYARGTPGKRAWQANMRYGQQSERPSLDAFEQRSKVRVVARNTFTFVQEWPAPPWPDPVFPKLAPFQRYTREQDWVRWCKPLQPRAYAVPRLCPLPARRYTEELFCIVARVDGLMRDPSAAGAAMVVEVKARTRSSAVLGGAQPPWHDVVQTAVYQSMLGLDGALLLEAFVPPTGAGEPVLRAQRQDAAAHLDGWRQVIVPRLCAVASAVYSFRRDPQLRRDLLLAASADAAAQQQHHHYHHDREEQQRRHAEQPAAAARVRVLRTLRKRCPWLLPTA
jgi:hypothetical protein